MDIVIPDGMFQQSCLACTCMCPLSSLSIEKRERENKKKTKKLFNLKPFGSLYHVTHANMHFQLALPPKQRTQKHVWLYSPVRMPLPLFLYSNSYFATHCFFFFFIIYKTFLGGNFFYIKLSLATKKRSSHL